MRLRVLVVDDSAVTRTMIADFLTMTGHLVVGEAENQARTLELLEAYNPDLITLDLSMGQEDGFAVLKAVRRVDQKVKVVIVSANTQQEVYDQLMKDGATGFLMKPFSVADLSAAVSKAAGP
ncbi:MAG: response regulator [Elusimicrobia bacterium]|nr:response regulator [Elusimicrobiota bacterium]